MSSLQEVIITGGVKGVASGLGHLGWLGSASWNLLDIEVAGNRDSGCSNWSRLVDEQGGCGWLIGSVTDGHMIIRFMSNFFCALKIKVTSFRSALEGWTHDHPIHIQLLLHTQDQSDGLQECTERHGIYVEAVLQLCEIHDCRCCHWLQQYWEL